MDADVVVDTTFGIGPSTVEITGNFTVNLGGHVTIKIDGNGSGVIQVDGCAILNGTLTLDDSGGYLKDGERLVVVRSSCLDGSFNSVDIISPRSCRKITGPI